MNYNLYLILGKKFCRKGWKKIGERCFQFGCTIPTSWNAAERKCRQKGAYLARIASKIELDEMFSWVQTIKSSPSMADTGTKRK